MGYSIQNEKIDYVKYKNGEKIECLAENIKIGDFDIHKD